MTDANRSATAAGVNSEVASIDLAQTWGEWGGAYIRFAESKEVNAIRAMRSDLAKALAAAQALRSIMNSLSDEQSSKVSKTIGEELHKLGY